MLKGFCPLKHCQAAEWPVALQLLNDMHINLLEPDGVSSQTIKVEKVFRQSDRECSVRFAKKHCPAIIFSLSSLAMVEMFRTVKRFTNSNGRTMPDLIPAESEVTAQYWLLAKVTHGFSAWVVKIWILGIWLQIRWWFLADSHQKRLIQHVQNSANLTRCYANSSWLVRQVALEIFHQMPELSLG